MIEHTMNGSSIQNSHAIRGARNVIGSSVGSEFIDDSSGVVLRRFSRASMAIS